MSHLTTQAIPSLVIFASHEAAEPLDFSVGFPTNLFRILLQYFMRLLHVISSVDPKGGGPIEGIKQRGRYLQTQGHEVEVLSLDAPDAPHVQSCHLKVHAVGPAIGGYGYAKGLTPWLLANARRYDHIVISGLWQYHGLGTSRTLRHMKLPYHVFTHGMLDSWFKHQYPLKHLKKWIYWALAEYHVLRHATTVFFTSEEERIRSRESFWLYSANECVVPYGTSLPPQNKAELAQAFLSQHPELANKHLLLYLSRIHEKKGVDLLIEAFAKVAPQHHQAHLIVAGGGDDTTVNTLKAQAKRLGVADRMTWLGMVQGKAKWQAFHASQAFVLPSHQENFGIAVAEALGCGLPVLISDKINIWREIDEDGAGLVAPDTAAGTLHNLQRWLQASQPLQKQMAEAAAVTFKKRFTVEAMGNGLVAELESKPLRQ